MLSKSFFTLPAESLKKKYGREALLGHATRYHGDVNLKNTTSTGIMQWPRLNLAAHFLLKLDSPLQVADPGLNITESLSDSFSDDICDIEI